MSRKASKQASGRARIGTSGYQYDHWKGVFYPENLARKQWFAFYGERFDTVEINNTFYHLPKSETFDSWHEQAPPGFCYVLKYSRYGSHIKRLKDPQDHVETFLAEAQRLKSYLGPILVQLPPRWGVDTQRLAGFLEAAPRRLRWSLEFRDPSWLCEPVFELLRKHRAALCIHDMIENHPRAITADWVYLRYHGPLGGNCYSHQFLSAEASRIASLLEDGLDVFAFFNNDAHGHAIANAADLRRYVGRRSRVRGFA